MRGSSSDATISSLVSGAWDVNGSHLRISVDVHPLFEEARDGLG